MNADTPEDAMGRKEPSTNADGNASLPNQGGVFEKLNILEGDGWMTDYHAKMLGPFTYAVLSLNNGQPSQHVVNLYERSCTCEDKTYNVDRAAGMCRHQLYAIIREDGEHERDTALLSMVAYGSERLVDTAKELRAHTTAKEADRAVEESSTSDSSLDPADAEGRLRDAIRASDYSMNATDTGEYEGTPQVLFKMGHEDFEVLKAATSGNDLCGYNGEYNTLDVADVDDYIRQVLE